MVKEIASCYRNSNGVAFSFRFCFAGSVTAVVLVGCKNLRTQKFIMGKGGGRMKKIALAVEQDLRKFFLNDVRIKLVLVDKNELEKNDQTDRHFHEPRHE